MAKAAPRRPVEPTAQYSFRFADSVAARADRLLEPEQLSRLSLVWQRVLVSRSAVFRECLMRGLADFEAELELVEAAESAPAKPVAKAKAKGRK